MLVANTMQKKIKEFALQENGYDVDVRDIFKINNQCMSMTFELVFLFFFFFFLFFLVQKKNLVDFLVGCFDRSTKV